MNRTDGARADVRGGRLEAAVIWTGLTWLASVMAIGLHFLLTDCVRQQVPWWGLFPAAKAVTPFVLTTLAVSSLACLLLGCLIFVRAAAQVPGKGKDVFGMACILCAMLAFAVNGFLFAMSSMAFFAAMRIAGLGARSRRGMVRFGPSWR